MLINYSTSIIIFLQFNHIHVCKRTINTKYQIYIYIKNISILFIFDSFIILQVPITQLDDKRQMTVLMACTKSGSLLPPQLIYQGKTDACHPNYDFPEEWDIYHTESHWSNSQSMERQIK
jgi:hypothetical protein